MAGLLGLNVPQMLMSVFSAADHYQQTEAAREQNAKQYLGGLQIINDMFTGMQGGIEGEMARNRDPLESIALGMEQLPREYPGLTQWNPDTPSVTSGDWWVGDQSLLGSLFNSPKAKRDRVQQQNKDNFARRGDWG